MLHQGPTGCSDAVTVSLLSKSLSRPQEQAGNGAGSGCIRFLLRRKDLRNTSLRAFKNI